MPFKIKDIQVEQACKELKKPLFVLPPKSPDLNAGVERLKTLFTAF
jgi:hypothetical protein